jgi:hypothetical protein
MPDAISLYAKLPREDIFCEQNEALGQSPDMQNKIRSRRRIQRGLVVSRRRSWMRRLAASFQQQ